MKILKLAQEDYKKIFVMSDLHGELTLFNNFLIEEKVDKKEDLIIINGDSIDRGENSKLLLERYLELIEEGYKLVHLLGNHENMMYEYVKLGKNKERYFRNDGEKTLALYAKPETLQKHISFIEGMNNIIEFEEYIIVHGGLLPNVSIEKQNLHDIIWIRDEFIGKDLSSFGKRVIYGHTINPNHRINFNKNGSIAIDCGAYDSGILGVLELKELREIYITKIKG